MSFSYHLLHQLRWQEMTLDIQSHRKEEVYLMAWDTRECRVHGFLDLREGVLSGEINMWPPQLMSACPHVWKTAFLFSFDIKKKCWSLFLKKYKWGKLMMKEPFRQKSLITFPIHSTRVLVTTAPNLYVLYLSPPLGFCSILCKSFLLF